MGRTPAVVRSPAGAGRSREAGRTQAAKIISWINIAFSVIGIIGIVALFSIGTSTTTYN